MNHIELYNGPLSVLACGAAGSIVRVVLATGLSWRARVAHLISGPLTTIFVAPWVIEYLVSSHGHTLQRAVSFGIGLAGPYLAEILVNLVQRRGDAAADKLAGFIGFPPEIEKSRSKRK